MPLSTSSGLSEESKYTLSCQWPCMDTASYYFCGIVTSVTSCWWSICLNKSYDNVLLAELTHTGGAGRAWSRKHPFRLLHLVKEAFFCQIWKKKNSVCGNHFCFPTVAVLLSASLQPRSVQLKLEVIDFGVIVSSRQSSIFLPSHIFLP